jgi:hypothetical protein
LKQRLTHPASPSGALSTPPTVVAIAISITAASALDGIGRLHKAAGVGVQARIKLRDVHRRPFE